MTVILSAYDDRGSRVCPVVDCSDRPSRTKQSHKDECDINRIIRKYDSQGILTHLNTMEAQYGDVTGVDFQSAMDLVIRAQGMFDALPSAIRNEFGNDPARFLDFMDDEANLPRMVELGLVPEQTGPEDLHPKPEPSEAPAAEPTTP